MKQLFAAIALALVASNVHGQTVEVTPFVSFGYTTAAGIDKKAATVQDLAVAGGLSWGAQAALFFSDRVGMEVFWTRQRTDLKLTTSSGTASLFDMNVDMLHVNFVYHATPRGALLQPFVFGGVGPASFTSGDLPRDTKLALNVGGGLKWFPSEHIGVRFHARLTPIHLASASSPYCDPFGFCQDWLNQFDITSALALRF